MNGKIIVVGLGAGNEDQLSLGIYKILTNQKSDIYLRTREHPVVSFLDEEGVVYETFDMLYDTLKDYDQVYQEIARILIEKAGQGKQVIYAVPGHPMVAEKSVQYLIDAQDKVNLEILGGESFLDAVFTSLQIDPVEGFLFLNGEEIKREDIQPTKHMIISQVYDQWVASEVKLTLMEVYPDEWPVVIASNLGIKGSESVKEIPLYQLDYNPEEFHHLSSVFVRKTDRQKIIHSQFSKLVEVINTLRSPNGCPWDRAQNHQSIRKNLIEEMYELLETIDQLDMDHMKEELGDVLLQVMLHSQFAAEDGYFHIYDVIKDLNDKLVRRHPHVFGNEEAEKEEEAFLHWEKIKEQEREEQGKEERQSILDGIPKGIPEILRAYKLQSKAAKVGFDWDDIEEVYRKIEEEIQEIKQATPDEQKSEIGDLLFAAVNLARFMKVDPEAALAMTNHKFKQRFHYIEEQIKQKQLTLGEVSLEVMDQLWNEAKEKEN